MAEVDDATANWIKRFEGFSSKAYGDYKQTSIGHGTRARPGEKSISREEAHARLVEEAGKVANYVDSHVPGLDPGRRAALISFGYNLGTGYKGLGGLMGDVKKGDWDTVATRMQRYNHAGGEVLDALTQRRAQEAAAIRTGAIPEGNQPVRPAGRTGAPQVAGMAQSGPGPGPTGAPSADLPDAPMDTSATSNALMQQAFAPTNHAGIGTTFGKVAQMLVAHQMQKQHHEKQTGYQKAIAQALAGSANDPNRLLQTMLQSGDPGVRDAALKSMLAPKTPKPPGQITSIIDPKTGDHVSVIQNPDGSIQRLDPRALGANGGGATRPGLPGPVSGGGVAPPVRYQGEVASPSAAGDWVSNPATGGFYPRGAQPTPQSAPQGGGAYQERSTGVNVPHPSFTIPEAPEGADRQEWKKGETAKLTKLHGDLREKGQESLQYLNDSRDIQRQVAAYDPAVFTPQYASDTGRSLASWIPNLGLTNVDKRIQQRDQLNANVGRLSAGYAKATLGPRLTDADMARAEKSYGMSGTTDQKSALELLNQRAREAHGKVAQAIQNGLLDPSEVPKETAIEGVRAGVYKPEWFGMSPDQAAQPVVDPRAAVAAKFNQAPSPQQPPEAAPSPQQAPGAPSPQQPPEAAPAPQGPWMKHAPDPGAATRPYEVPMPEAAPTDSNAQYTLYDKLTGAPGTNLGSFLDHPTPEQAAQKKQDDWWKTHWKNDPMPPAGWF